MLKIPSLILGGLLVLTGLIGYLAQDSSLSIKISGPWDSDAEFVLSDGKQEHILDFIPCDDSAGENAYWIVYKLNQGLSKTVNSENYKQKQRGGEGSLKSFWYASSTGDTLKGLFNESENYRNAGTDDYEAIDWSKIDVEEAKVRFIYNNLGDAEGPVTLSSSNWKNVIDAPENGESLEFGKSWTALIPSILGLLLIVLAMIADAKPQAKKHVMHFAVLVALLGFLSIAGKVVTAFLETSWWRNEPFLIYDASSLKPMVMLFSAGLLLIYVVLCIVSFVAARKEMAAQAERDAAKKAAEEKKKAKEEALKTSEEKEKNGDEKSSTGKDSVDEKTNSKEKKDDPSPTSDDKDDKKPETPKDSDLLKKEDRAKAEADEKADQSRPPSDSQSKKSVGSASSGAKEPSGENAPAAKADDSSPKQQSDPGETLSETKSVPSKENSEEKSEGTQDKPASDSVEKKEDQESPK